MTIIKAKTSAGWVEGLPSANQRISVFKGVPFAAPPIGSLRWKAPQPHEPWEGVLPAYKFADIAVQERFASEGGNVFARDEFYVREFPIGEDCLYLNIWTPAKTINEKLPVAIYFHGGGFVTGYSYLNAYDGDAIAKRGMVFVSIPYRLNVFGFLGHPELTKEDPHHSCGNYGFLDQVAAIKWVKENIEAFGGDADNIALFGQSAGGMSVRMMSVTPLTKGDFKRAIIQSGGGVMYPTMFPNLSMEESEAQGISFFQTLGVNNLEEARRLPAEEVLAGMVKYNQGQSKFMPCATIDGYLLPKSELEICREGGQHDIAYMLGCTEAEFGPIGPKPTETQVEAFASTTFHESAKDYLEISRFDEPDYFEREIFVPQVADEFLAGALSWGEILNELGRRPAYLYYFTQVPPGCKVAFHSAEHHYVFQTYIRSNLPYSGVDFDLSQHLANYWVNFLKSGDPNGPGLVEWKPYTKMEPMGLEIKYDLEMIKMPEKPIVKFMKDYAVKGTGLNSLIGD